MPLKDLEIYKISHEFGEAVYKIVARWKIFDRDTLGKQLVRSADSVSFNISEGYGRFFYQDKRLFYYYSRGSLYEAAEGIKKAYERNLINESDFLCLSAAAKDLAVKLNNYIASIVRKIKNAQTKQDLKANAK